MTINTQFEQDLEGEVLEDLVLLWESVSAILLCHFSLDEDEKTKRCLAYKYK
jgi:hypothetical protein